MKKVVDVCTRVEGHGNIKILLQKDEISSVNFDLEIFRGFENILLDKRLIDTPRIASRICGLCHASQTIASCKAIESMYEVEPSNQSVLLRRLLMIGELIRSHSMHFFFQAFPDLFVILDKQPKPLSLNELIHFDPKLTSNMYELIKIGNEIGNLFGGRSVHLITPIIGGVFFSPSKKEINIARKYLQNSINNLKWIIERFIEIFSQFAPPDVYSLPNPAYMGMHNDEKYDRYNGLLRLAQNNKIIADFPVYKHSQYFDKQEDIRGIDFYLKNDQNILVGPLARYKIINDYGIDELQSYIGLFNKEWQNSILFSNVIRLIEMMFVSYEGLSILDDTELT
ncbi:MAG: nickel-dependent hydrogenase large subunit, partial [Candidatus Lokiarchaeota archaeon]|nr:nickel-dependent hydrogenase large subunit [Candidatus Lokiarchaeota archaeon]